MFRKYVRADENLGHAPVMSEKEMQEAVMDCVSDAMQQGFINGISHAVAERWISVKDKLPPEQGQYLVYIIKKLGGRTWGTIITMSYSKILKNGKYKWNGKAGYAAKNITHWMPLPAEPRSR